MTEEFFEIIDDATEQVIGKAPRRECHGNPALIHRSVHVIVLHPDGQRILLQKRSQNKDIQPGKWDTAVGGHLACGENYEQAAVREMGEELGLPPHLPLRFLFPMKVRNELESENVKVFSIRHAGPFRIQETELDDARFWTVAELKEALRQNTDLFTPVLQRELKLFFQTLE